MSNLLETIDGVCGGIGAWRRSTAIPARLGLLLLGTVLMGLLAQLKIPLPWTPVPIYRSDLWSAGTGRHAGRGGRRRQHPALSPAGGGRNSLVRRSRLRLVLPGRADRRLPGRLRGGGIRCRLLL